MTTPLTNDLARAFAAIRRWWWIVVAAAVIGGSIGVAGATSDRTSTYDANVGTPAISTPQATWYAPATQLAADLQSSATRDELGAVAEDTSLVTTVTPEPSSAVDVRVTAPSAERAAAATSAYAEALAEKYDDYMRQQIQERLSSVETGIEVIGDRSGDESIATLADLRVEQAYLEKLIERQSPVPAANSLTSGGTALPTMILLMLAFGGLTAAVIGFLGLGSRMLRFTDDVTAVTGEGSLVAAVSGEGNWAIGSLVDRLAAESGRPVTMVPVGTKSIDDLRDTLLVGVSDSSRVHVSPPVSSEGADSPDGPVLLVARLGVDTRRQLDSSHRAFSAANQHFVGVVAVDGGA